MRAQVAACLMLVAGCGEDLTEAWEVKEPRLMGARVESEGDPSRPRPRLGERFSIRQYLALPGPLATPLAERYSMDVALCLGIKAASGELTCLDEQELAPTVSVVSEHEILLSGLGIDFASLSLPPELVANLDAVPGLADLDRLALFGVLCVDGKAERIAGKSIRFDPPSQLFRCVGNEGAPFPDASTFTLSVLLDRGRPVDRNQNPSFACDPAAPDSTCNLGTMRASEPRVGGTFVIALPKASDDAPVREVLAWPASDPSLPPSMDNCASDQALPKVRAGSDEHTIRVRFDPSDREPYEYEIERNGVPVARTGREGLLLTHAVSTRGGKLARYASELFGEESDADAEISFGYEPPKQSADPAARIPETGRRVRFYFTLRDQRGGVDFTTRELCVVPSASQE